MPPLFILPLLFWPQYLARLYVTPCEYLRPCSRHHVWPKYRDVFNVFVFVSAFFFFFAFLFLFVFFFSVKMPMVSYGSYGNKLRLSPLKESFLARSCPPMRIDEMMAKKRTVPKLDIDIVIMASQLIFRHR